MKIIIIKITKWNTSTKKAWNRIYNTALFFCFVFFSAFFLYFLWICMTELRMCVIDFDEKSAVIVASLAYDFTGSARPCSHRCHQGPTPLAHNGPAIVSVPILLPHCPCNAISTDDIIINECAMYISQRYLNGPLLQTGWAWWRV